MSDLSNKEVTNDLIQDLLKEKRSDRRWRNFRSIAWFCLFAYFAFNLFSYLGESSVTESIVASGKDHISLIRLDGMIAPGREFSAEEVIPLLHDAFSDKTAKGVVIDINSPGGTPVQAAIIHDAIMAYKTKYHKKVIIIGEDMLTSGAYYVAVAADRIYVNPNTITGSIGVVMKGFGFVDLMKKIGVERRVYVSGNAKDRLDPFLPQNQEDLQKISQVMSEVHDNFMQAVIAGRKGKLHGDPKTLFNGDFWSGQSALKLGLVDGLGNLMDVAEKEFHTTTFREYGTSPNIFKMLGGQLGSAIDSMGFV